MKFPTLDSTWVRLKPDPDLGDLPGLFVTTLEFMIKQINVDDLGLSPTIAEQTQRVAAGELVRIPELDDLGLNVFKGDEVGIVRLSETATAGGTTLVEGTFPDEHPDEWIDLLASKGRALLAVSSRGPEQFTTLGRWMATWRLGVVRVAVHVTTDGVGIRASQRRRR